MYIKVWRCCQIQGDLIKMSEGGAEKKGAQRKKGGAAWGKLHQNYFLDSRCIQNRSLAENTFSVFQSQRNKDNLRFKQIWMKMTQTNLQMPPSCQSALKKTWDAMKWYFSRSWSKYFVIGLNFSWWSKLPKMFPIVPRCLQIKSEFRSNLV